VVAAWVRGRKREVEGSRAAASRCEDNGVSVRRLPRRLPQPVPAGTPLQRALLLLDQAVRAAREDERADAAFVEMLCDRAAKEALRRLHRERRP
jgi:hypothetical protein